MARAAIYHSTDESKKRPIVYQKDLDRLEEFANEQGYDDVDVYCDMTLIREEQAELQSFLENADQYDALFVKDCRRISKNTMQCFRTMQDLFDKGVAIYSNRDGVFVRTEPPVTEPRMVATYTCRGLTDKVNEAITLQQDIFNHYTKTMTAWTVVDQYSDISRRQYNGEQPQLQELIENRDKYDLLLVRNLNDVHWHTADFCKIRQTLQMDIYSLQDGFMPIHLKESA